MLSIVRTLKSIGLAAVLVLPFTSEAAVSDQQESSVDTPPDSGNLESPKSNDQIAREMSNPLAAFYSLSYSAEKKTYQGSVPGAGDQDNFLHVFQPVIPFLQKNGKGFVFRLAVTINPDQPVYRSDRDYAEWLIRQVDPTANGEGAWYRTHGHTDDTTFDIAYGGANDDGFILMYGLAGVMPTASDTTNARQQLIMGPELNIGKMTGWGVYGALISHVIDWREKEGKDTVDANMTTVQAYFSYALGNGWQLISNPVVSYDWEGDSGNKLALPLGGGISKTMRIGKMPLRMSAELYNYVASTDRFGPEWLFEFSITPVLWNKYTRN